MRLPEQDIAKRVGVAGAKHTTLEFVDGLARRGYRVDHVVTIPPELGQSQDVAGYLDLREPLSKRDIPWTHARKYSLKSEEDEATMLALNLDLLFVIGWQRLIPDWWLSQLSIGAFGMHGSSKPLPYGRGRSPMNWSLIQNKTAFYTHLFRYAPGVDDGHVVGVQIFDINPWDTAQSLHYKNTLSMIHLASRLLPDLLAGTAVYEAQSEEGATYYPKRSPEDGLIWWPDGTTDIHNLIRAVTRPFAGAFTYLGDDPNKRVVIWRAQPFDTRLRFDDARPGEVLEVFHNGDFLVRTGTDALLVLESDGYRVTPDDIGRHFGTLGQPRKIWENIPL